MPSRCGSWCTKRRTSPLHRRGCGPSSAVCRSPCNTWRTKRLEMAPRASLPRLPSLLGAPRATGVAFLRRMLHLEPHDPRARAGAQACDRATPLGGVSAVTLSATRRSTTSCDGIVLTIREGAAINHVDHRRATLPTPPVRAGKALQAAHGRVYAGCGTRGSPRGGTCRRRASRPSPRPRPRPDSCRCRRRRPGRRCTAGPTPRRTRPAAPPRVRPPDRPGGR